jgi:hypothetical protein
MDAAVTSAAGDPPASSQSCSRPVQLSVPDRLVVVAAWLVSLAAGALLAGGALAAAACRGVYEVVLIPAGRCRGSRSCWPT